MNDEIEDAYQKGYRDGLVDNGLMKAIEPSYTVHLPTQILPKPFTDKQIMEATDDSDEQYMLGFNRCLEDIAELNREDA